MESRDAAIVSDVIRYIESHLDGRLELGQTASALHYSKYHLHRIFTKTTGFTFHDYASRRQLTEAARLLAFSEKPILEIALLCGYESQQAFTAVFRAMYKESPARFRRAGGFYPLQLALCLNGQPVRREYTKEQILPARPADLPDWMELLRLTVDGYPRLDEARYLESLLWHIKAGEAFLLRDKDTVIGAMAFSALRGHIEFLAVHPQYRSFGISRLLLDRLREDLFPGRALSITTYRAADRADTGYREEYRLLGFLEQELLVEYGYPAQRFVLPPGRTHGGNQTCHRPK